MLKKTDGYDFKIIPSLFPLAGLPFRVARKYFYGGENRIRPRLSIIADNFFASFRGGSWPRPLVLRLRYCLLFSYQQTTKIGFRVGKSSTVALLSGFSQLRTSLSELLKEKILEQPFNPFELKDYFKISWCNLLKVARKEFILTF